jgi:alpha-glucosidase
MHDVLRFWLNRGVDGFRVDVLWLPEIQNLVTGLRRVLDEFDSRVLIGEIYLPLGRLMAYCGTNLDGVHLPFNFQLLQSTWNARCIAALIDEYKAALPPGGWPNWVLGNHDSPRIASRAGLPQAPVAAMLLLTLRGTPTLYYGDELGMVNVPIAPNRVRDPLEKNVPGRGSAEIHPAHRCNGTSRPRRDSLWETRGCRSPMTLQP